MSGLTKADRPVTAGSEGRRDEPIRFCARCGQLAEGRGWRPEGVWHDRVCGACGMGLVLSCDPGALQDTEAMFLVVTGELEVSAVSESAERIFASEEAMIGTPLLAWVSSPLGDQELARRVALAAWSIRPPVGLPLSARRAPASHLGTLTGRVATCGPPRAALIVVEPPHRPER
jgi:hypothetical protein